MNKPILISIKDVTKTYHSNPVIHALKGVNLDIFQGEVLSLLGVNGAGKTTLSSIFCTKVTRFTMTSFHFVASSAFVLKNPTLIQC